MLYFTFFSLLPECWVGSRLRPFMGVDQISSTPPPLRVSHLVY